MWNVWENEKCIHTELLCSIHMIRHSYGVRDNYTRGRSARIGPHS